MSNAARQTLHDLVDELPADQIPQAQLALERMKLIPEQRAARDERDAEIINANADKFRSEMEDILGYQAD